MLTRERLEEGIRLYQKFPFLQSPAKLGATELPELWANPKHLQVLNKELMAVYAGKTERLGAHMPPQHGKTWLSSWMFPAWCLLNNPNLRIVLGMHTDTYAATYGRRVGETVNRFGAQLGIRVSQQSSAANEWEIEGRIGRMVAKGVNSSPVGRPADLLIIDDPYENIAAASSLRIRDRVWDWYFNDVYSRLGPTTRVVLVHTRFFTDDLAGRAYKKGQVEGKPWRVINFPAIAEENDILGRKKGDPLWQERVPLERLMEYKGTPFFDAIQQQHPVDADSLFFKPRSWPTYLDIGGGGWRVGREIFYRNGLIIAVTVDWATSEKETSDFTAIGVFGLTQDGRVLVLEVVNERYRLEDCVPRGLAPVCRKWWLQVVSAEADVFQAAMVNSAGCFGRFRKCGSDRSRTRRSSSAR